MKSLLRTNVLLLMTLMAAFSTLYSVQTQPTHLKLWYAADPTDPFRATLESAIQQFNAGHTADLQIDTTAIAGAAFDAQLQAAIASGNPPDVFSTTGGNPLRSQINTGMVREIPEITDLVRAQYVPGAFESTTFEGKYFAIPVSLDGVFLWYNVNLLRAQHVDPPTTWNKLIAACKQLKAAGLIPISLGNQDKWPGALWMVYLASRIAPNTPLATRTLNRAAYVEAGARLQEAVQAGCFQENFNNTPDADARLLLANGKAAMQLQGSWNLGSLKQANQALTESSLRTLPFPTVEGGQGDTRLFVGGASRAFVVAAKAPSESGTALLELLSSDAFNRALAENDIIPARLGYAQFVRDPIAQQIADALAEGSTLQLYFDQALRPEAAQVHLDTTQQLLALTLTPEQAASALEQALNGPPSTPSATTVPVPLRQLAQPRGLGIGAAAAVAPLRLNAQYQAVLKREFNMLTPENALKTGVVRPTRTNYDFSDADAIVGFAQANGMQIRGHTLVYGKYLPDWLNNGRFSREELLSILHDYIQTVVGRYRGRITTWDVVNEAIDDNGTLKNTLFLQTIGPQYIDYAFQWAHEADPDAQLFYNDYGGEDLSPKSNAIYALVQDLRRRGIPINGVGLQMHLSLVKPINMTDVATNIKRLGALGLQVQMTELDVETKGYSGSLEATLAAQAQLYHDAAQTCLQASACKAITTWGFTDQFTWLTGDMPLPFDKSYRPKPAYLALSQVFSQS